MKEYSNDIKNFYPKDRSDKLARVIENEEVLEAALGIAGEAGEVADIIKKYVYYGKSLDLEHLREELGDTFHYLVRIAYHYGFSVQDLADHNVHKLEGRFAEGVSDEAAIAQGERDANI